MGKRVCSAKINAPARLSAAFNNWQRIFLLLLFAFAIITCSSLPAYAAVEAYVAKSSDGTFHQYSYQDLLDSYSLKLVGMSNGLYEDFAAKKTVAFLNSQNGYLDYQDVLTAYALSVIRGESFSLRSLNDKNEIRKAVLPATIKLVTLTSGRIDRKPLDLQKAGHEGQSIVSESTDPPKEEPKKPVTVTPIIGQAEVTLARAIKWASSCGAHQLFIDIAPLYWDYGSRTGMRPEVLYAQAAHETAFGRYSGQVPPAYNNWAGIKTVIASGDTPEDHEQFATSEDGVRGHFNHMSAYIGLPPLGEPHARYHIAARLSWAGTITTVEELSGRWAPSPTYHERILAMVEAMQR